MSSQRENMNLSSFTLVDMHQKTQDDEKPHPCTLCDKSFVRSGTLDEHIRLMHTGENLFYCVVCTMPFPTRDRLNRHMTRHSGEKPFGCPLCEKQFPRKSSLDIHLISHSGLKPYGCQLCDKHFSLKSKLKLHMMTHSGEKPYVCDVCDKMFSMKDKLNIHIRIHTGEKPYNCTHCNKRFPRKSSLDIHLKIHSGEKPFGCHLCSKHFSLKSKLSAHVKTHSGIKPYCCFLCDKKFLRNDKLKSHMKIHSRDKSALHGWNKAVNQTSAVTACQSEKNELEASMRSVDAAASSVGNYSTNAKNIESPLAFSQNIPAGVNSGYRPSYGTHTAWLNTYNFQYSGDATAADDVKLWQN